MNHDVPQDYYSLVRPELQLLVRNDSRRILDVGCGAGMLGSALKIALGCEVWGVEPVTEMARSAASRLDRVLPFGVEEADNGWKAKYIISIVVSPL